MKQLERDVLSFGLTSDWIDAPFRVGFRCQKIVCDVPIVGTRTHTLECPFEGCNLTFAEAKEQNRHTLRDHTSLSAQSVQFDLQKATSFGCPMTNCSKSFKTKGWLKSHLQKNHKSGSFLGNTFVYTSVNGEASEVPDDPHTGPSASSPPQASNFNGHKRRRALRSNPTGSVEMRNAQANRVGLTAVDPRCSEILNNTDNITLLSSDTYAQGLVAASKGPDIAMTGRPTRRGSETSKVKCRFPGCPKELPTLKGIVNHMSRVHRMSYATGGMVRERATKRPGPKL